MKNGDKNKSVTFIILVSVGHPGTFCLLINEYHVCRHNTFRPTI